MGMLFVTTRKGRDVRRRAMKTVKVDRVAFGVKNWNGPYDFREQDKEVERELKRAKRDKSVVLVFRIGALRTILRWLVELGVKLPYKPYSLLHATQSNEPFEAVYLVLDRTPTLLDTLRKHGISLAERGEVVPIDLDDGWREKLCAAATSVMDGLAEVSEVRLEGLSDAQRP